jgi:3-hydroxyacyl-CoA dehydrogenase
VNAVETPVVMRRDGAVLVVTIDNPPVNAASAAVRAGLRDAIRAAEADAEIRAVVIACAGRTFVAGADIREFGKPPVSPLLPEVASAIEDCAKPVVAALHGTALGGGFEIALSAHARVAAPGTGVGLPEVKLGIIPGAGGTQRLPRLAGLAAAIDIASSGRVVKTDEALRLGLIDAVVEGDLVAGAVAHARTLIGGAPRRTGALATPAADPGEIEKLAAAVAKKARGQVSPTKAVEAVRLAATLPLAEGLAAERAIFADLVVSDQAAALRHVFFAEREAAKVPGVEGVSPRPLAHVGVVGAGTMGAGIAVALAEAGLEVTIVERDAAALETGRARVAAIHDRNLQAGRVDAGTHTARRARTAYATDLSALGASDLIIEAVFEDFDVKAALLRDLDRVAKPGAILATNTSYLDVDALAAVTSRPADVLGLHFFSPANVMRLLEVVRGRATAPDTLATGLALGKRLGKLAVTVGVCDGFVGNRMLAVWRRQCEIMVEEGAAPHEIDQALEAHGFAMGPFAVQDLAGLDIAWARRKRIAATRDPAERTVAVADRLCEAGRFGQKTGAGWYAYANGKRAVDPLVTAIIAEERTRKGIAPRQFAPDAIVVRVIAAMADEGFRILDEGIAARASDIDLVKVNGYGYPAWRGGPMFEAGRIGWRTILAEVERMLAEDGGRRPPAAGLVAAAS